VFSHDRAVYEQQLARAHRALYVARGRAEDMRDDGSVHDLDLILVEVTRLADASLRGKLRVPTGQGRLL
jgi:hypothetical protein